MGLEFKTLLLPQPIDLDYCLHNGPPDDIYGRLVYALYGGPVRAASWVAQLLGNGPPSAMGLQRAGRCLSALLGALCTLCILLIGRMTLDSRSALLAGTLCACAPGMVFMFHGVSVNAAMTALMLACCAALVRLATTQRERWAHWLLIGALFGLAVALKESAYTLLPAGLAGVLSYRLVARRVDQRSLARFAVRSLAAGALAVSVYVGANLASGSGDEFERHLRYYVPSAQVTQQREAQQAPQLHSQRQPSYFPQLISENLGHVAPLGLALLIAGLVLLLRSPSFARARPLGWLLLCLLLVQFAAYLLWTPPSVSLFRQNLKGYDVLYLSALATLPLAAVIVRLARARRPRLRRPGLVLAVLLAFWGVLGGVAVDAALLHPSAEQPLRSLINIKGDYTLARAGDYDLNLPHWIFERVTIVDQDARYVLAYDRDVERERLLQAGYGVIDDFDYPAWVYLALPDFRLQTDLTLLG
ncbi:MAG: glycosyltransferase family 39 protein, partial [Candidatus Alcyoniella australis]|nr:glycosyltransferase family 39 protein [Candidatus Alcyoniella australis]